jgi:hypothetical protein
MLIMPNAYTDFVKQSYAACKSSNPGTPSKDILRLLARDWQEKKNAPVAVKPKPRRGRPPGSTSKAKQAAAAAADPAQAKKPRASARRVPDGGRQDEVSPP